MNKILLGDCLEELATLDADSVDSVVSDPPYGLEFMGQDWDSFGSVVESPKDAGGFQDGSGGNAYSRSRIRVGYQKPAAYQQFMTQVAEALLRVMKPGAYGLMFGGTRTYHRVTCALEDAGFEIRDCLGWLYGSGFPKSSNQKGDWAGWGTALKPAWEPVVLFRKPSRLTVPRNLERHGVGALNVDGCRVGKEPRINDPAGNVPGGNSLMLSVSGMPRDATPKPCFGRWPANILHDGSDEVLAVFPESKSGSRKTGVHVAAGGSGVYGDYHEAELPALAASSGSASRFFYCAKASKADRDEGLGEDFQEAEVRGGGGRVEQGYEEAGDLARAAGAYGALKAAKRNTHPTVKPTALMRYLCRLVTPPGGLVLDPFTGSGSTGKAAVLEGLQFLGIEKNPEYVRIAEARVQAARMVESEEPRAGDLDDPDPKS